MQVNLLMSIVIITDRNLALIGGLKDVFHGSNKREMGGKVAPMLISQ